MFITEEHSDIRLANTSLSRLGDEPLIPCRICSATDSVKILAKNGFDIVRCTKCNLEYTDYAPTAQELKNTYGEQYLTSKGKGTSYFDYLLEEDVMTRNAKKRLAEIEKVKPLGGSILDVGCATGFFLSTTCPKWSPHGVELSEASSSYARDRYGIKVTTGTLKQASYQDDYLDVITMWDVIEHLAHPLEELLEANRILKQDGLLVLTTGDVNSLFARICGQAWHLYNPPQHLSFFSEKTIRLLLKKGGFYVRTIRREGSLYTVSYLTSMLSIYYPHRVLKMVNAAIYGSPIRRIPVHINLRDIMTVYATKARSLS